MSEKVSEWILRNKVETVERWQEISKEIPFLQFDKKWKVRIVPPWAHTTARFSIKYNGKGVSVFLDWHNKVGYMGEPYYEIHADCSEDCERFTLEETNQMMERIKEMLEGDNE